MSTTKKLFRSDIRKQCGENAYLRGQHYYEKQMVQDIRITNQGTLFIQINSAVKGQAIVPYKQNIRIVWRPDHSVSDIQGDCTCPVGYNCKHVAAVCLYYADNSETWLGVNANDCLAWLHSLSGDPDAARQLNPEFLAYYLGPGKNPHEYVIELSITKLKKNGELSKGRKTTLSNLRYSYSFIRFLQPEDEEITKLLSALDNQGGQPLIAGDIGHLVLTKMLRTHRLYWLDGAPPLTADSQRMLSFTWQHSERGYQLLPQLPERTLLIPTDPPCFIDTQAATLGTFDPKAINPEQLKKILTIPVVPDDLADQFTQQLITEHPSLPLPPPQPVQLTELEGLTPIPSLRLFGQQTGNRYRHLLELIFQYGKYTVSGPSQDSHSVISDDQQLIRIHRDQDAEHQAWHYLLQQDLVATHADPPDNRYYLHFDSASNMAMATAWNRFLSDTLPLLEQQGWLIAIDPSFLLNFQTAQQFVAEIDDSQNDWFDMSFTLEINGQHYALLPLIMPVLENYDLEQLPELLCIPLADHSYLNLPSEQLRPILNVLYELFNSNALSEDGKLSLSRFNVASLSCLDEQGYGLFSLRGGKALRELAQKLKNFTGIETVPLPAGFNARLRPYQQQGLNWLQFLREYQFGGILADDMGLGKTIQTLAHLLVEKRSGRMTAPSLIIAPTSLMGNWRRECERFTPDLTLLTLQGSERKQSFTQIGDYDLVLTTYPLLPRDEEILLAHHYHYLILDEAQTVKNPLSKAAQLVRQIKTQHRLCLTGTPMENHLGELWAQFDFLMPGFLGDGTQFKRQYRTPIESHGDQQQRLRLTRRIAPFMLRRSKQDVACELPAKTEIVRSVALYPKQAALYESIRLTMEQKVRQAIAQKGLARSHITILDALLKLRQTCCDPRTLSLKEAGKVKASAKLDLLMELLPEQLEEGRRILVFSQFTRMIALIEQELSNRKIGYSKLTGQTKKREEAIALFKNGSVNVFLISLKAGGVGLNLTEADTVILYDPWWNPATESQAADRAHRIGQDKPVFIYKLVTEHTVEEKILAMQERKRALADGIYREENQQGSLQLTADDLTALFEPL